MTGADLFVSELQARGVTWISALCGNGLDPLLGACRRAGVRLVDTRNEQTAAYMAECWGRLTRRVGVCAVSSGVAHANAMTGVLNAAFDGAPMLLITGAGPLATTGMGHFQDLDHAALAAPACKYARVVDAPERIPQLMHEAFAAALSGRPGPAHLTLPMCVQNAPAREAIRRPAAGEALTRCAAPEALVERAAALLSEAERPLLVAGSGAYYAGAEEALAAFAGEMALPVAVPIWDRGAVPADIPQFMGVLGAATGGPRLLPDADLVILLGAACDYRVGYLRPPGIAPEARILRVDVDPARLRTGGAADLAISADPGTFLGQLRRAAAERRIAPFEAWLAAARHRRLAHRRAVLAAASRDGIRALHIIEALAQTLTDESAFVLDGGCIGQWFHQVLCDRYPARLLTCGASGVIGFGIAGAMAARLARPDAPVLLLSGDGSMTFTIADIECATRQRLPFVAIVADDQSWGIVETGHRKRFGEPIASHLGPIRFDLVAEGFGARGVAIHRPEEIAPAIREGLAADRPTVIHVPITTAMPVPG
ncbi:MAG: thiamine pyrophosphate-binding protein [Armatimonadetes bacterium]|nr:thiamine pyrophosphate-binding protein [Armatimonadota bacterium]